MSIGNNSREYSTWSLSKLPDSFSCSGTCLSSAAANAVNLVVGELVVTGEEMYSKMTLFGVKSSSRFNLALAMEGIEKKHGVELLFCGPKGALKDTNDQQPVIGTVNFSRFKRRLAQTRRSEATATTIADRFAIDNHAVLIFNRHEREGETVVSVFDINWSKAIDMPQEMLDGLVKGAMVIRRK